MTLFFGFMIIYVIEFAYLINTIKNNTTTILNVSKIQKKVLITFHTGLITKIVLSIIIVSKIDRRSFFLYFTK